MTGVVRLNANTITCQCNVTSPFASVVCEAVVPLFGSTVYCIVSFTLNPGWLACTFIDTVVLLFTASGAFVICKDTCGGVVGIGVGVGAVVGCMIGTGATVGMGVGVCVGGSGVGVAGTLVVVVAPAFVSVVEAGWLAGVNAWAIKATTMMLASRIVPMATNNTLYAGSERHRYANFARGCFGRCDAEALL